MPTYSMTRRSRQIRSQNFSAASNVSGRKRTPAVEQAPPTPPAEQDALLLDGDTGFLLQETNNKLLLDK